MKRLTPMLLVLFALISCAAPNADRNSTVSKVTVYADVISERTIAPSTLTRPTYYSATLTNSDNTYSAESESGELSFNDVFVGDYKVAVYGYDKKGGSLIYRSEGDNTLSVTVKGANTISIQMFLVNDEGTGTVKVNLDWTEATNTEGLVKDKYLDNAFIFDLYKVDEDKKTTLLATKTAEKGAKSYLFEASNIAVSNGFTGYFDISYEQDGEKFLLMRTSTAVFQVYAGQTSVPDDNDAALFIINAENMPDYFNVLDFEIGYSNGDEKETSLKVLWNDSASQFSSVIIACSNGETKTVDAALGECLFTGLEKNTKYTFTMYGKSKRGKETEKVTLEKATKVFVRSVSFDESSLPSDSVVSGTSFSLSGDINPVNATDKRVTWSTSDTSILEPIPTTADSPVSFYAKAPGEVTITVTAVDEDLEGNFQSYTSSKKVSVVLASTNVPEVIVENNDISKGIIVSWSSVDYATGYDLYRNGVLYQSLTETSFRDSSLMANHSYSYSVKATCNEKKTDGFDPTSAMSGSSESLTPVLPTITLVEPTLDRLALEINAGEAIKTGAITVTPDSPVVMNIPSPIAGATEYAWFVNGVLKAKSSDFATVNAITLTSDIPEVQDYEKDANSIMLRVKDSRGNYHSASAYFRVILVKDTGVEVTMDDHYSTTNEVIKFKAHVVPTNATMQAITYSSSDDSIASIDSKGVITIKKYGTVTFTATPYSGNPEKKTIRFYDNLTDEKTVLNYVNREICKEMQIANTTYGGDWWEGNREKKITSEDGTFVIKRVTGDWTTQYDGTVTITDRIVSSDQYGDIQFSTLPGEALALVTNAKQYLGDSALSTIGRNDKGTINVTLPYDQGNATIRYMSINVNGDRAGKFIVTMPSKSAVTFDYSDSSLEAIF